MIGMVLQIGCCADFPQVPLRQQCQSLRLLLCPHPQDWWCLLFFCPSLSCQQQLFVCWPPSALARLWHTVSCPLRDWLETPRGAEARYHGYSHRRLGQAGSRQPVSLSRLNSRHVLHGLAGDSVLCNSRFGTQAKGAAASGVSLPRSCDRGKGFWGTLIDS